MKSVTRHRQSSYDAVIEFMLDSWMRIRDACSMAIY
ncbi:MAG: hypothetical protein ETSY1_11160 [Candidatus Entotheonella factor]|uniref:Uncharacterized protein n=1 Tax=Entotheonella factor TaxID=1429438 RepID=W4LR52_ENTF1|nr:MAG: hypothetical protein ETSY1_11160 [Candidatus Entotheonella factor]